MTYENGGTLRLTAHKVPEKAVRAVAEQMRADGIPVRQSALVLYVIAKAVGIPRDKLAEFCVHNNGAPPRQEFFRSEADSSTELETGTG